MGRKIEVEETVSHKLFVQSTFRATVKVAPMTRAMPANTLDTPLVINK